MPQPDSYFLLAISFSTYSIGGVYFRHWLLYFNLLLWQSSSFSTRRTLYLQAAWTITISFIVLQIIENASQQEGGQKTRINSSMDKKAPDHYYTAQPASLADPQWHEDTICGIKLRLCSDHGVFSRGHTDTGTRELLAAVEFSGAKSILDLGCGYGVIGIVAAKLEPTARVLLTDPNERAIALTLQNMAVNGVTNAEARLGEGLLPAGDACFDLIVTNPPIRTGNALVFSLIEASAAHLNNKGAFYLVARTKQGAKTFAKEMSRHFAQVDQVGQGSGYRVYRGKK